MRQVFLCVLLLSCVFGQSVSSCMNISVPGTYSLTSDLKGASVYESEPYGPNKALSGYGCIVVSSSDVSVDCAGHSVMVPGELGALYGVLIQGRESNVLTNITIRNCNISGYGYGVLVGFTRGVNVDSNSITKGTHGIYLWNSPDCTLSNNIAYGNLKEGIHLDAGSNGTQVRGNVGHANGLFSDPKPRLPQGTAFLIGSDRNTLEDNVAYNQTEGFVFDHSSRNTVVNNSAFGNAVGFTLVQSDNNVFENIISSNNTPQESPIGFPKDGACGILINNASNNRFSSIYIEKTGGTGIQVGGAGNSFLHVKSTWNILAGISIFGQDNSIQNSFLCYNYAFFNPNIESFKDIKHGLDSSTFSQSTNNLTCDIVDPVGQCAHPCPPLPSTPETVKLPVTQSSSCVSSVLLLLLVAGLFFSRRVD